MALQRIVLLAILLGCAVAGPCVPYQLPADYASYQDMCKALMQSDDSTWESAFDSGVQPQAGDAFPLQGAVLGCMVGADSSQTAQSLGLGVWNGKVIGEWDAATESAPVENIVVMSALGGNVVTSQDWESGLDATAEFHGTITIGDAMSSGGGSAYLINYSTSPGEGGPYGTLVASTRDEIRSVGPGIMVGRTWSKPFTAINPLPFPVDDGAMFALFQVCTANGEFAGTPGQRDLNPAPTTASAPGADAGDTGPTLASFSGRG